MKTEFTTLGIPEDGIPHTLYIAIYGSKASDFEIEITDLSAIKSFDAEPAIPVQKMYSLSEGI
jgi:hypothetical protein